MKLYCKRTQNRARITIYPNLWDKKATAATSIPPTTQLTGTSEIHINRPRARGDAMLATVKDKNNFVSKTEGMNGKVFNIAVTQYNQFINTHTNLAKFVTRDDKKTHQVSQSISEITLIV